MKGPGPFTLFAPTDDAFDALEMANPGILAYLLANPNELTEILLYHVASGNLKAADVLALGCIATLQGGLLNVDAINLKIDGACMHTILKSISNSLKLDSHT